MPLRKIPQTRGPKMELHGKPMAGFSKSDLERRARELAEIDNRLNVTDEDRERARVEFMNRDLPEVQNEDADSMQSMSRDPSDPATDRGHQTPNYMESTEDRMLQRLVLEGVEEAQHDQMTAARAEEEPFRSRPKRMRRRPPQ